LPSRRSWHRSAARRGWRAAGRGMAGVVLGRLVGWLSGSGVGQAAEVVGMTAGLIHVGGQKGIHVCMHAGRRVARHAECGSQGRLLGAHQVDALVTVVARLFAACRRRVGRVAALFKTDEGSNVRARVGRSQRMNIGSP